MDIFSNPTVSAFFGALFAFLLVAATDWRRRRRTKSLLTYLVSDNIDLARSKLEAAKTNIALLQEDGEITAAPFMRFSTQSIKEYQHEILGMLNANEKQGLEVLIFRMEAIDGLTDKATTKAKEIIDCKGRNGIDEEISLLCDEYRDSLEMLEKNLNQFIKLATHYKKNESYKILEFQHPISNDAIT